MILFRGYGWLDLLRLSYSFLCTKFFFKNCRIIRQPIYIRNKHLISFGAGFTSGRHCRIDCFPSADSSYKLKFGENCQINDNVHIAVVERVTIGSNVLIASRVFISDHNHGLYKGDNQSLPSELAAERVLDTLPVEIGDNVWIGEGVAILPGVSIGNNTIIGANAVVTKSFGENQIIAGNPARIIKKFSHSRSCWVSDNYE